jgi:enamine deaminase RidA (YjgF/YER057c/UK114 family)
MHIDDPARVRGPFSRIADSAADLVFTGAITPHLTTGVVVRSFDDITGDSTQFALGQMLIDVPDEPAAAQARAVFDQLMDVLDSYGLGSDRLVRLRLFLAEHYLGEAPPAISVVFVSSDGLDSAIKMYLDAVAYAGVDGVRRINGGPAGTVTRGGDYVFVPNTVGTEAVDEPAIGTELPPALDALTFSTPTATEVLQQSWTLFQRMDAALREAGGGLENLLKVNGWLSLPMRYYGPAVLVRDALAKANDQRLVASTGLSIAGLPEPGAHIGFEGVAYVPSDPSVPGKEIKLPQAAIAGYYVGAVRGGGLVFTCGEVPIDGPGRRLVDQCSELSDSGSGLAFGHLEVDSGMRAKAWYVYRLHEEYLKAYDLDLTDVIHQTVYLKDAREIAVVERVGSMFFGTTRPPTTFVPIIDTSPFTEAALEIEVVARAR